VDGFFQFSITHPCTDARILPYFLQIRVKKS